MIFKFNSEIDLLISVCTDIAKSKYLIISVFTMFNLTQNSWLSFPKIGLSTVVSILTVCHPSLAQITSNPTDVDAIHSTIITSGTTMTIKDGLISTHGNQANIFHSFKEFSIPSGMKAEFINPLMGVQIQNIITRVTGGIPSNINGEIKTPEQTNLFLINPAGIIFGPEAKLTINGSFLASTATAIKLADGTIFSANNPQTKPLLTMSVPTGLQFGNSPGNIEINQSNLSIESGKTFALIGGNIIQDGSYITAPFGRLELGSVGSSSEIGLTMTGSKIVANYQGINNFLDINLINGSAAYTIDIGGGDITIYARKLSLKNGSYIESSTIGDFPGGNLLVNTSDLVEIEGISQDGISSGLYAQSAGMGNSGNLEINTPNLLVKNGGLVDVSSGQGNAGNLSITAKSIKIIGDAGSSDYVSSILAATLTTGNGGNITINTDDLLLQNGGIISLSTFGSGNAGNLNIQRAKFIEISGVSSDNKSVSGLFVSTQDLGKGGSLQINNVENLLITDGGQITAATNNKGAGGKIEINSNNIQISGVSNNGQYSSGIFVATTGSGNAGNLQLITENLLANNGGRIGVSSSGSGQGGNLDITASKSIKLIGKSGDFNSALSARSSDSGDAGTLLIKTPLLTIENEAKITVEATGTGNAGTLEINAKRINLDSQAQITAATKVGAGGNINLQANNLLLMRNNSLISATAGGTGNGGNIIINSPFIVGISSENSDIFANAFQGRGGNINITTDSIYGLEFRPKSTPFSDITASSEFGINGTVQITTPGIDPSKGLNQLSTKIIDVSGLVKQDCIARTSSQNKSFVVTGRGGLPYSPLTILSNDDAIKLWHEHQANISINGEKTPVSLHKNSEQLQEAQGWIINNKNGKIILSANVSEITPSHAIFNPIECP